LAEPLIKITGYTKHYVMGSTIVRALDGVDMTIAAGESVSITGQSGSGKSTLMHLLGCLDRPSSGMYELDGQVVSSMADSQLARIRNKKIGFVFQTFNLIQRTSAVDNVAVPLFYGRKSGSHALAMHALERVGLADRATHSPSELSGGERQRVAIARAIVNEPRIILADEPTGNLDTKTGRQIIEIFHGLHASGVTIILVTHEMEVAMRAQRIIRMRDGCIVEDRVVDDAMRGQAEPVDRLHPGDKSPPPMARPAEV
jgi:putative ABC transport system ATP-binding protein